jgi:hypothetical protein
MRSSHGELPAGSRRVVLLRRRRVRARADPKISARLTTYPCRSYSGYGKVGFDRRFRVYDVAEYGERVETYKRTEHGDIVDREVLVGRGSPAPYEGT